MGESDKECKYCLEPEDQEEGACRNRGSRHALPGDWGLPMALQLLLRPASPAALGQLSMLPPLQASHCVGQTV